MATKRAKTNLRNQNASVAVDRISGLPDPIIHHILSFVPTIDVVRTSLLSKRWRCVWYSVPSLHFSDADVARFGHHGRKAFYKFVGECLKHREEGMRHISGSNITRFKLDVERFGRSSALDKWLSVAVGQKVKELELRVSRKIGKKKSGYYCLPATVLDTKSLIVLKLDSLKLNGSCSVTLPCLKSLSLSHVDLNDNALDDLLSGCPSLEKLLLKELLGLSKTRISSSTLKFLEIITSYSRESHTVEAINLESVVYSGSFKNLNISACKGIRRISLLNNWELDDQSLEDTISGFPLLESFTLSSCCDLKRIKICGQHLKSVRLEKTFYDRQALELSIETPNEVSFSYMGDTRFSLRIKSPNPSIGSFIFCNYPGHDNNYHTDWYVNLITFLSNMTLISWSQVNVHAPSEEALIIPENLRRICCSPWWDLKDLKVKIYSKLKKRAELRDALYWISPSLKTLAIQQESENTISSFAVVGFQ